MSDSYRSVAGRASAESRVERSIFIGHAAPAADEETARRFVAEIRELHRQATHNPFAYAIGYGGGQTTYFHDHGEPGGTAGKPILGAIARLELTDVVVVVTRYFGGKKLGVRGLIEAYGASATQALEAAGPVTLTRTAFMTITADYPLVEQVLYVLGRHDAEVIERRFGEKAVFCARVALSKAAGLHQALQPLADVALSQ